LKSRGEFCFRRFQQTLGDLLQRSCWLTLNCRGDWASRAKGDEVVVRFADQADQARAAGQRLELARLAAE